MGKWLYLLLDIMAISGPLVLSFDKKIRFFSKWKAVFSSIFVMMLIFIPMDSLFTAYGIWGFNERYTLGYNFLYLPFEEWLFFPATHFAILFVYECLNYYLKNDLLDKIYKYILLMIAFIGILLAVIYPGQLYTSIKCGGAGLLILVLLFLLKPKWLSRFTLVFLVSLIPFFLMNSILTGSLIDEEIVWYNPAQIVNIRIGTIPIEDVFYNLFMLFTTALFYHRFNVNSPKE